MSLGAWIFLSVVVFVFAPILSVGIIYGYICYRGKKLLRMIEEEFNEKE